MQFLTDGVHPIFLYNIHFSGSIRVCHFRIIAEVILHHGRHICRVATATVSTVVHVQCRTARQHQRRHSVSLHRGVFGVCIVAYHIAPIKRVVSQVNGLCTGVAARVGNFARAHFRILVVVHHLRHSGCHTACNGTTAVDIRTLVVVGCVLPIADAFFLKQRGNRIRFACCRLDHEVLRRILPFCYPLRSIVVCIEECFHLFRHAFSRAQHIRRIVVVHRRQLCVRLHCHAPHHQQCSP